MENTNHKAIVARNLVKIYCRGSEEIRAVNNVSLTIDRQQFVAFVGPSGSGKTTLLNVLGCLDNPTAGSLEIEGQPIFEPGKTMSESQLTRIRRDLFGYIFQKFYLIPTLSVRENVMLPFAFYKKKEAAADIFWALQLLGIEHRLDHLPGQLSGGEMQRVAIARALVNRPKLLLADEPTGNLDVKRSEEIGQLLKQLNKQEGLTIVLVTHNPHLAQMADKIFELRDGQLMS